MHQQKRPGSEKRKGKPRTSGLMLTRSFARRLHRAKFRRLCALSSVFVWSRSAHRYRRAVYVFRWDSVVGRGDGVVRTSVPLCEFLLLQTHQYVTQGRLEQSEQKSNFLRTFEYFAQGHGQFSAGKDELCPRRQSRHTSLRTIHRFGIKAARFAPIATIICV